MDSIYSTLFSMIFIKIFRQSIRKNLNKNIIREHIFIINNFMNICMMLYTLNKKPNISLSDTIYKLNIDQIVLFMILGMLTITGKNIKLSVANKNSKYIKSFSMLSMIFLSIYARNKKITQNIIIGTFLNIFGIYLMI